MDVSSLYHLYARPCLPQSRELRKHIVFRQGYPGTIFKYTFVLLFTSLTGKIRCIALLCPLSYCFYELVLTFSGIKMCMWVRRERLTTMIQDWCILLENSPIFAQLFVCLNCFTILTFLAPLLQSLIKLSCQII